MMTQSLAGAFLRWQDEVLLLHRGMHKKITPGLWAGIGGHIEPDDASPYAACLREIEEETGINAEQIERLDLRYFALCESENTLDSIYYFAGVLTEKPLLRETPEGQLHWIKLLDGLALPMSELMKALYTHWVSDPNGNSLHCFIDGNLKGRML